ncbi:choice-of-anchor P family protein [Actinokineospora terrae]|uniref:LPXTG-motif cell wall anchor domain-containing protein n=1 Tax=Actinokineospora terrae TaxID=155974 RepID=A0A1H9WUT0_9PSEU|nr:choice-of-anchor P family protein [Actinokineospora terrae]SES37666.1 hypothetical protein SAMN04487818_111242 [Actinokineospora terrae]
MYQRWLRRACATGVVASAVLLAGATPAVAAPGDASAHVASARVALLGQTTAAVGPLAPSAADGPTTAELSNAAVPGVATARLVSSSAIRDDNTGVVRARASLTDVGVVLSNMGTVGAITVTCEATQTGITGRTSLADVSLKAAKVPLDPPANTTAGVPNVASLVFNEQIRNRDGSLTVNGVHLRLNAVVGEGDLVLGSVTCGVAAPPMPMASGSGLWAGIGLLALVALPVGVTAIRRRRVDTA